MGSFNVQCSVSNRTISVGDKVAVLVLTENKFRLNDIDDILIYPNDMYDFVSSPIIGRYNDYGGLEYLEDTQGLRDILNYYFKDGKELDIKDSNNLERINDRLREDKLMFIKGDVYDYLTSEEFKNELYKDGVISNDEPLDLELDKEGIKSVYDKWLEYDILIKEGLKSEDSDKETEALSLMMDIPDFILMDDMSYRKLEEDGVEVPLNLRLFTRRRRDVIYDDSRYIELNTGNFEEYFSKLNEIYVLDKLFKILNLRIIPSIYGGQGNDSDIAWDIVYSNLLKP